MGLKQQIQDCPFCGASALYGPGTTHPIPAESCYDCGEAYPIIDIDINRVPVLHQEELILHGELVAMTPVSRCPLTEKRLLMTYNQGGKLIDRTKTDPDWWKTALAPFQRVYSVGRTPKNAIRALGKQVGWGKLANYREMPVERPGEWYYRFVAGAGGTSMKAGGRFVPGGCILDYWC